MNWKFEAMEKLRLYEAKKQSLRSIPEEIERLESAMKSIRSATADETDSVLLRAGVLLNCQECGAALRRPRPDPGALTGRCPGGL